VLRDILVCLQGWSSEAATALSLALAHELKADLVGLAIVDEASIRTIKDFGISSAAYKNAHDDRLVEDAKKQGDGWAQVFEQRCEQAGIRARTLGLVGRPAPSILATMAAHDLTVLGLDVTFNAEPASAGPRTRDQILRHAVRPVLLVPAGATPPLGQHVLIAYDGSGAAKRAALSFAATGLAATRTVHVATVDDDGASAWEMAQRGVELLRAVGVFATPHNLVSTLSNTEALFQLARELGAGLIVMGAFAHSRLAHLLHQSTMRGLIEKSTVPLYLQPE
jgi:nucleotide-binding universal stress UspA family protein